MARRSAAEDRTAEVYNIRNAGRLNVEVMAWCRLAVICAVVWMIEMTVRLILKSAAAAIVSADLIVNPLYYGFLEYDGAGDSTLLSKKNWNTKKM